jgi:hypothetical protein
MSKKRELAGDGDGPDQEEIDAAAAAMDAEDEADDGDGDGDREDRFAWDEDGIKITKKAPVDPQPE